MTSTSSAQGNANAEPDASALARVTGRGVASLGQVGVTATCAPIDPAGYRPPEETLYLMESPGRMVGRACIRMVDFAPNGPVTVTTWVPASRTLPVLATE